MYKHRGKVAGQGLGQAEGAGAQGAGQAVEEAQGAGQAEGEEAAVDAAAVEPGAE